MFSRAEEQHHAFLYCRPPRGLLARIVNGLLILAVMAVVIVYVAVGALRDRFGWSAP
jgi:hypothetical protein